mmetsp:Transcript_7427/g.20298  ORF Transcript_7427/g.20298 Transcript_7427/m.20298 type:complete len:203 (+) Transcript_7427:1365-1973(+)
MGLRTLLPTACTRLFSWKSAFARAQGGRVPRSTARTGRTCSSSRGAALRAARSAQLARPPRRSARARGWRRRRRRRASTLLSSRAACASPMSAAWGTPRSLFRIATRSFAVGAATVIAAGWRCAFPPTMARRRAPRSRSAQFCARSGCARSGSLRGPRGLSRRRSRPSARVLHQCVRSCQHRGHRRSCVPAPSSAARASRWP